MATSKMSIAVLCGFMSGSVGEYLLSISFSQDRVKNCPCSERRLQAQ